MHRKCTDYCLRKKKNSNHKECRMGFPQKETPETTINFIERKDGSIEVKITYACNDQILNKFFRCSLLTSRSNTDFGFIIDKRKTAEYLSKYVSKLEKKSKTTNNIIMDLLKKLKPEHNIYSVWQKIFIACEAPSHQEISAQ